MTNPISGSPRSREAVALDASLTTGKSFVNKDFAKNLAFLNQTADVHTAFLKKLQAGVDDANSNVIEQIQGFAADLFIMFAGGEPTGIEVGDLKYVIQGIGALLGINPETPFPLNLFDAALHFLQTYIIPLEQFSDVIFDSIEAWAVDLGLSPELIESLGELRDSFENLWSQLSVTGEAFFAAFRDLLEAFMPTMDILGELWEALVGLIDGLPLELLKPVLALLADLGIPFIKALTLIVNAGTAILTPFSLIAGSQIVQLGENVVSPPSAETTIWSIGSNSTNAWVFDETQSDTGTDGSFTTLGNGLAKRFFTQKIHPVTPGEKIVTSASLKWDGVPSAPVDFGYILIWYTGVVESSVTNFNVPAGHGSTGGFALQSPVTTTVPEGVDGVRIGGRIGTGFTSGQVWIDRLSAQKQGLVRISIVDGLLDILENLLPLDIFDGIIGTIGATVDDIADWFGTLLDGDSPLNSLNLFNLVPNTLIGGLDASKIISGTLDKLLFPNITADMSTDMQGTIDAIINAAKNGTGVGQAIDGIKSAWIELQTKIFNKFGGNTATSASQAEAAGAIDQLAQTLADQAAAINDLQNKLEGANGFAANVSIPLPVIKKLTTTGAFTFDLPTWWKYGEYIIGGAGGGGKGMFFFDIWGKGGDAGLWNVGNFERDVEIPSSTTQLTGSIGSGGAAGAAGGGQGGDGQASTLSAVGGTFGTKTANGGQGGKIADAGSVAGKAPGNSPATDTGEMIVGGAQQNSGSGTGNAPGGGGAGAQVSGAAGGAGARGEGLVKVFPGVPTQFTNTGSIVMTGTTQLYKLNVGKAITDSMTASAIFHSSPRASKNHVIIIRANTEFDTFVYLAITVVSGVTQWRIGRVIGGSVSIWKSGTIGSAVSFNAFSLTSDNARTFTVAINGVPFDSYTDTLETSAKGDLYRWGGWGSSETGKFNSLTNFAFLDTGTPARIQSNAIVTQQSTNSTAYVDLASPGPSVTLTVPQSGEVTVNLAAFVNTTAAGYMSVAVSGVTTLAASDENAAASLFGGMINRLIHLKGLNPGTTTFTAKYKAGSGTVPFSYRNIIVDPKP